MDNNKIGLFISELRKSNQLTQKELAIKLNISDKAVSKWERGLSCPDISLLSPLSNIFNVTTTELLNGERAVSNDLNIESVVVNALEYGEKAGKRTAELNLNIIAAAFSILLLIGIFVVLIVDMAISRMLSWSLIPITAIVFMWIVFFPTLKLGTKGIIWSFITFSVFVTPFLYVLDYVIDRFLEVDTMLFSMGIRILPLCILFLWIAYFLFKKLRTRILLVIAILVFITSPISYFTNAMISNMLNEPFEGITLVLNTFTPVIVAAILFIIEFALRKKHTIKS
jgi:transcriptional regulator with XRE-family HTH domain